jgi:hypothetical protein
MVGVLVLVLWAGLATGQDRAAIVRISDLSHDNRQLGRHLALVIINRPLFLFVEKGHRKGEDVYSALG